MYKKILFWSKRAKQFFKLQELALKSNTYITHLLGLVKLLWLLIKCRWFMLIYPTVFQKRYCGAKSLFFNKVAILGLLVGRNRALWAPFPFWNVFAKLKTHFFEALEKAFAVSVYFNNKTKTNKNQKKKTRTMIRLSLKCCNFVKTYFSKWIFFHTHIKYACKIRTIWSSKAIPSKHCEYGILKLQN